FLVEGVISLGSRVRSRRGADRETAVGYRSAWRTSSTRERRRRSRAATRSGGGAARSDARSKAPWWPRCPRGSWAWLRGFLDALCARRLRLGGGPLLVRRGLRFGLGNGRGSPGRLSIGN